MTYEVYCGLWDVVLIVEADSEEQAIELARVKAMQRMKDANFYVIAPDDDSK